MLDFRWYDLRIRQQILDIAGTGYDNSETAVVDGITTVVENASRFGLVTSDADPTLHTLRVGLTWQF